MTLPPLIPLTDYVGTRMFPCRATWKTLTEYAIISSAATRRSPTEYTPPTNLTPHLPLYLLPSFSICCWPRSPRCQFFCSSPLWWTLSSMISANLFPFQFLLPSGSIPLLQPATLPIFLESLHLSPESSAYLLRLSRKPNPPIVRPLSLTPLTISSPTSSLQFPTP